jgi:hypothetical protein
MWWMILLEMGITVDVLGYSVDVVSSVDRFLMTNMSRNWRALSVSTSMVNLMECLRLLMW